MAAPYPHDTARQTDGDRAAQFLAVFRMAVERGFYPEVFGNASDKDIIHLCGDYIAHATENLTIFDPNFLEALYGKDAGRKAHWLIELRMRRMDIVPALWQDLQNHVRIVISPSPENA